MQICRVTKPLCEILKTKTCIPFEVQYTSNEPQWKTENRYILTHTSNAKCFMNVTLINIRDIAVFMVPFRGYGRLSRNQVMIKNE